MKYVAAVVAVIAGGTFVAWVFVGIYLPARQAHQETIWMATPGTPEVLPLPGDVETLVIETDGCVGLANCSQPASLLVIDGEAE